MEYKEVDGDDCAYVKASYFIKEGSAYKEDLSNVCFEKGCRWKLEDSGVLSGEW